LISTQHIVAILIVLMCSFTNWFQCCSQASSSNLYPFTYPNL